MPDELNPDFPVVDGRHRLTDAWTLQLPAPCNRRVDDGDLVLWRPGLTAWIAVWHNDNGTSIDERVGWVREDQSPGAYDAADHSHDGIRFYSYRLDEADADADGAPTPALYGYAYVDSGHVQMAIYFDDEADAVVAQAMFSSLRYAPMD
jgi:hypothetical protein